MNRDFRELILIALGKRGAFSHTLSDGEWTDVYREAAKQSLIGVCYAGIERLPAEQRPEKKLLMEWFGQTEHIKRRNRLVSARAAEVTELFAEAGFKSVVLKGQGVAVLYNLNVNLNLNKDDNGDNFNNINLEHYRQSGDIDLWVDGKREDVIAFMNENGWKVGKSVIHHTDVEIFKDVSVEIHHVPSFTYSPFRWRKYKRWFREQAKIQMQLMDKSKGFAYPCIRFNAVYSLLHIFRHVFHEGVGLRQLMDYYFILEHTTPSDRREAVRTLRWLGLQRFAAAVMYVLVECFEIGTDRLLCEPDAEAGRFLMNEIVLGGNFGKYDKHYLQAHQGSGIRLYVQNVRQLFRMVKYYPSEVLWAPAWKISHFVWRKLKGYS